MDMEMGGSWEGKRCEWCTVALEVALCDDGDVTVDDVDVTVVEDNVMVDDVDVTVDDLVPMTGWPRP